MTNSNKVSKYVTAKSEKDTLYDGTLSHQVTVVMVKERERERERESFKMSARLKVIFLGKQKTFLFFN